MNSKDKYNVIEPNSIAEARGPMNKAFIDILHTTLAKAADDDDANNLSYSWKVTDYCGKYGFKYSQDEYRKVRRQVDDAFDNSPIFVTTMPDGTEIRFNVFQSMRYLSDQDTITVSLTSDFKAMLVKLMVNKGRKIYFSLPDTLAMKSEYGKRMYPILLEYVGKPIKFAGQGSLSGQLFDRIDSVDDLRSVLYMPDSYKISNIKHCCELIEKDINGNTNYEAKVFYNVSDKGRGAHKPITHVCWTMRKKDNNDGITATSDNKTAMPEETSSKAFDDNIMALFIKGITNLDDSSCERIAKEAVKHNRDNAYIVNAYNHCGNAKDMTAMMMYFMITEPVDYGAKVNTSGSNEDEKMKDIGEALLHRFDNFKK